MTLEEIEYYKEAIKEFAPLGSSVALISVIPWPSKPFDPVEYYVDFKLFTNLFASEKLSELTLERFFECCDTIVGTKNEGYARLKTRELRSKKISQII